MGLGGIYGGGEEGEGDLLLSARHCEGLDEWKE